jgi:hypothetical protein
MTHSETRLSAIALVVILEWWCVITGQQWFAVFSGHGVIAHSPLGVQGLGDGKTEGFKQLVGVFGGASWGVGSCGHA